MVSYQSSMKKIFCLLALLIFSHTASAKVTGTVTSKAWENSSIRLTGNNLDSASACFEFFGNSPASTFCRSLKLKSYAGGNMAIVKLPSVVRDTKGNLVIKNNGGEDIQKFSIYIRNRRLFRHGTSQENQPRQSAPQESTKVKVEQSNSLGSIVGTIIGCTNLANNSFSVHLVGTSGSSKLDSNRKFKIRSVPAGTFKLIVNQYGMEAASVQTITVREGQEVNAGNILIKDCG
ncbi:MAG: hypothetical protein HRT47_05125 [Candidatus Caenarcaniphilales bacterium]|nr:hypothetical protein [Candidatus Caenarcaniphilales bacterium]